jgi:hypothetical protein
VRTPLLVELNGPARSGAAIAALRLPIHATLARTADVTVGILEILATDARRLLVLLLFHGVLPVAWACGDRDTRARGASDVPAAKCTRNKADLDRSGVRDESLPVKTPA